MPKQKRTSTAKKGWKTRSKISEAKHPRAVKRRKLWDPDSMAKVMDTVITNKMGLIKLQYNLMCRQPH